jgi:AcrR family transcriptional regulator
VSTFGDRIRSAPGTRGVLIDVAAALPEEGGGEAVTLREVGRRAGVSHNAPYRHFADKKDLLAAVAAHSLSRYHRSLGQLKGERSAIEVVEVMVHAYVREALAHPQLFRLTYGPWRVGSASAADSTRTALVNAVIAAQQSEDLPSGDPERLTALFLALAHGAADLALSGHLAKDGKGHASPDDLVDDLMTRLRRR